MNEPKQTEQPNIDGWAQLTLLDPAPVVQVRPVAIRSALRCPLCGAVLVHVIGSGLCDCPRCGAVVDL